MKRRMVVLIAAGVLVAGCRGNSNMKRNDQNYEVVQEGSSSEVTSTISGPGETPPPAQINAPPMTATNTDNTNAFALPQTMTATTTTTAGVGAGATLSTQMPATAPPSRPRVEKPRKPVPPATDTVQATTTTEEPPPATTTTEEPPPPPPTDTTTTTTTQKPPR